MVETPGLPGIPQGHGPVDDGRPLQRPRCGGAAVRRHAADEIAAFIIEPVMMNIGIVLPRPGYLEGLRDLCTRYGVVLIFDEVKCGATIAAGGAIERFGVQPDLACFAKSIAGGVPGGRLRRQGRAHGRDRPRRRPAGDVQRQPAGRRRRPGGTHRGAHPGRLRALQAPRRAPGRRLPARHRHHRAPRPRRRPRVQGMRVLPGRAPGGLPQLPRDQRRTSSTRRGPGWSTAASS